MCDTIVAYTGNGMLFGKNSDRDPDEVQNLEIIPALDHEDGEKLKCTYIDIPQVAHTHEVLLSKPYWMWGAEMGVNEHGVAIGNERLFTKIPARKENKYLIGMDLLRLGLERGTTSRETLDVMISLLQEFGQGGNHYHRHNIPYNNGFLIADRNEAYVLETVDRMWTWKKITTFWTISNGFSLTDDFDVTSPEFKSFAIKKRWASDSRPFNVRKAYTGGLEAHFTQAEKRRSCTSSSIQKPEVDITSMMDALRSHGASDQIPGWNPLQSRWLTVCDHETGFTSPSSTTGSLVAWCPSESNDVHAFSTASSIPCTSVFKYVYYRNAKLASIYTPGVKKPELGAYWWCAEKYNRVALLHYQEFLNEVVPERKQLEREWTTKVMQGDGTQSLVDETFTKADALQENFFKKHATEPPESSAVKGAGHLRKLDKETGLFELFSY